MKKFSLIVTIFAFAAFTFAQDLQKQATDAFTKGNYTKSAELLETLLRQKGESADLYYNLGNAYYKSDRIAEAILNYEKALLLSPGDDDIQHNLEIAKLKTVDKITPVGTFLLSDWLNTLESQMSSNGWARFGVGMFLFFIAALFFYFFAGRIWVKKIAFFGGIFVLLVSIFANYAAFAQKQKLESQTQAIVFSSSVVAKSTPDASGTDLFLLHQGTKVTLKERVGDWTNVELEDGNVGWIQNTSFQPIRLLE